MDLAEARSHLGDHPQTPQFIVDNNGCLSLEEHAARMLIASFIQSRMAIEAEEVARGFADYVFDGEIVVRIYTSDLHRRRRPHGYEEF